MNAAIEASRAGESGRGFSVVADETQTISAAAEQQSASIYEIADSSKLLSKMSEDLSGVIRKFEI